MNRDDFAKSTNRTVRHVFHQWTMLIWLRHFFRGVFASSTCIRRHMIYRSDFGRYWGLNIKNNTDVYVKKVLAPRGLYITFIAIKETHLFLLFDFWENDARSSQDDLYFSHTSFRNIYFKFIFILDNGCSDAVKSWLNQSFQIFFSTY